MLGSLTIDPAIASTSFSSKSELSLNITKTAHGSVATFMAYAGGGLGTLDVSNSDTTAYVDSTNPVTSTYGGTVAGNPNYAFNRAVVALNADGTYSTTQTLAYGGNNGRSAVLGANGKYYTVGNSNNGSGAPTQLTTSTGLEVVTPGATANSQMIDAAYQSIPGDKAGKDANFRGLTVFDNQLYFTKGSGSNGIDTVYTVSNPSGQLPTAADAATGDAISILPGLPTDSAKLTGGNFTPFGLFFANATTMYVADEGTGKRARHGQPRRSREVEPGRGRVEPRLHPPERPDRHVLHRQRHQQRRRGNLAHRDDRRVFATSPVGSTPTAP